MSAPALLPFFPNNSPSLVFPIDSTPSHYKSKTPPMSNPSRKLLLYSLNRLRSRPIPTIQPCSKPYSHSLHPKPPNLPNPTRFSPGIPANPWMRSFASKIPSRIDVTGVRLAAKRPLVATKAAVAKYREAAGLQVEAFWKRNYLVLVGAVALAVCIVLWRTMFGIASTFVGLSEGMAKYGFLALASAMVAFAGLYIRARFTINPDKIYRIAMRKLNTSAGALEIMGAPLAGTDVRAYVMSGGVPSLKNFKFRFRSKRCFLIFPIRGSERKGLVSVEAKKKKGQYDVKLLAVDIPMAAGPDQRIFIIGDEEEYKVGGGLIAELRDPIVKAMAAEQEFEELDEKEEEEDAERELEEEERKRVEQLEEEERKRRDQLEEKS